MCVLRPNGSGGNNECDGKFLGSGARGKGRNKTKKKMVRERANKMRLSCVPGETELL